LPDNAFEKRARQASQIGEGYFSLGSPHHTEPFEKARGYFEQALEIEKGRVDSWYMAQELWNIGKACEQLGKAKNSLPDYDQAEQCFDQAIDLLKTVGDQETLAKCLHSRIILLKNVFCYKKERRNFDGAIVEEIQKAFKELHDINVGIGKETEGIHNTKAQFYHALDKFPEMLEEINAHVEYYRNEFDKKGLSVLHKLARAKQTRQWLIRNSSLDTDPALGKLAQEDRDFYIKSMKQLGRPYS
jgi:tetratricopeptide (TPR) repeat protein